MNDETIRLLFQIDTKDVQRADAAMAGLGKQAEATTYEFADCYEVIEKHTPKVVTSINQVLSATQQTTKAVQAMGQAEAMASTSFARASTGAAALARGGKDAANAWRNFAYVLDDVQYVGQNGMGLRPILNNIAQFSGKAFLAGLALDQLYRHYDAVAGLFGQGHTEKEAERMERLAKATERTGAETAALAQYQKREKNYDAIGGGSKAQTAAQGAFDEAVKEQGKADREGRDVLVDALFAARRKSGASNLTPDEREKVEQLERYRDGTLTDPFQRQQLLADHVRKGYVSAGVDPNSDGNSAAYVKDEIDKIAEGADARSRQLARNDLAGARTDPAQLAKVIAELRRNGMHDAATALDKATPEGQAREAQLKVIEAQQKENAERSKAWKEATDRENELAERYNRERREGIVTDATKGLGESGQRRILEAFTGPNATRNNARAQSIRDITSRMTAAGMDADDAAKLAPAVFLKLFRDLSEKVRERVMQRGESVAEASAAILRDMTEKAAKDSAAIDRAERQGRAVSGVQAEQSAATGRAGKLFAGTGLPERVQAELQAGIARQGNGAAGQVGKDVAARLAMILKSRGMGDREAALAARGMVADAGDAIGMQAGAQGALDGPTYMSREDAQAYRLNRRDSARMEALNRRDAARVDSLNRRDAHRGMVRVNPERLPTGADFSAEFPMMKPLDEAAKATRELTDQMREMAENGVKVYLPEG